MDWTGAGVVGGIPSGSWTQCGTTIAPYTGTSATINSAIAACGSNQFVLLGAGTFTLSTGIDFAHKSNVVLRGSGSNSTFIVAGSSASINCNGEASFVCIFSTDSTFWIPGTGINWTAGYSQGTNLVTLSSTSGVTTSKMIVLNQCDTGFSGTTCGTGSSVDNGGYFNAGTICNSNGTICTTGATESGPDAGNGTPLRFQAELFPMTNVNSGTGVVTLGEGLKHPNWASGLTPQAWTFTPISNSGIENLSINLTSDTAALYGVMLFNSINCWAKGLRIIDANNSPFGVFIGAHFTLQDSYFWESQGVDSHAVHLTLTANGLIQNNIFQQIIDPVVIEGSDVGSVFGYNYLINDCNYRSSLTNCGGPSNSGDGLQQAFRTHANGDDFELFEGNVGTNYDSDGDHGTALSQTLFRNFFMGWESCGVSNGLSNNGPCGTASAKGFLANAFVGYAYVTRYHNIVGNVLGTPGYHSSYEWVNGVLDNHAIYAAAGPVSGGVPPYDPLVLSSMLRWGNYDVANAATLFCTAASTPIAACVGDERADTAPTYPGLTSPTTTLPASFYLSGKPAWFGSHIWPPIGPDVTSGNVGQCAGTLNVTNQYNGVPASSSAQCTGSTLNTAWAGHVNLIPAMDCYLNTMNGTPDGTGSAALTFDPSICYASSPPVNPANSYPGAGVLARSTGDIRRYFAIY